MCLSTWLSRKACIACIKIKCRSGCICVYAILYYIHSFLFLIMLQHHHGSRRKSQRQLTGHNIVCFLLYRETAVTCQDQTFHLTIARNTEFPDKDILCHVIVSVIDYDQALLLFVKSRIGDKIVISRSLFDRACEKLPVFLVDTDHFPVEIDQLLIFMSPWVGSSVIRIGKATDARFVTIINRAPGHVIWIATASRRTALLTP